MTMMRCHYSHTLVARSVQWKGTYPKTYCHGNEKVARGNLLRWGLASLCKCVSETIFMYVCETMFMYVCETTFMYACETIFHVCV